MAGEHPNARFNLTAIPYRFMALGLCLLIYGALSSPTPDNPHIPELMIAVLLIIAIGACGVQSAFDMKQALRHNVFVLSCFLIYGLIVTSLVGFFNAQDLGVIIRDIIAFLLLSLPLFLVIGARNEGQEQFLKVLWFGAFGIASLFALRVLFSNNVAFFPNETALLYLANSPLMIFFAIYGVLNFYSALIDKRFALRDAIYSGASMMMIWAMAQDIQRAPMAAIAISLMSIAIYYIALKPKSSLLPLLAIGAVLAILSGPLGEILSAMAYKTSLVGVNARADELAAIWAEISVRPMTALFGMGWGAVFASPALGGLYASYSHSLLSYMLYKAGIVGLFITLGFAIIYGRFIYKIAVKRGFVLACSLFWALAIPLFLYASYKSFDFGLLLSLIMALSLYKIDTQKTDTQKTRIAQN